MISLITDFVPLNAESGIWLPSSFQYGFKSFGENLKPSFESKSICFLSLVTVVHMVLRNSNKFFTTLRHSAVCIPI